MAVSCQSIIFSSRFTGIVGGNMAAFWTPVGDSSRCKTSAESAVEIASKFTGGYTSRQYSKQSQSVQTGVPWLAASHVDSEGGREYNVAKESGGMIESATPMLTSKTGSATYREKPTGQNFATHEYGL